MQATEHGRHFKAVTGLPLVPMVVDRNAVWESSANLDLM